jgi:hypothetical protein
MQGSARVRVLRALASGKRMRWDALVDATGASPDAVSDAIEVLLGRELVAIHRATRPSSVSFVLTGRGATTVRARRRRSG